MHNEMKREREREREKRQEINFVQVKTPTLGCLSNHYMYTYFLFIRQQHTNTGEIPLVDIKGRSLLLLFLSIKGIFLLLHHRRESLCGSIEAKSHSIIYNII